VRGQGPYTTEWRPETADGEESGRTTTPPQCRPVPVTPRQIKPLPQAVRFVHSRWFVKNDLARRVWSNRICLLDGTRGNTDC
jgi:hypothetical protein